ncbi:MAG: 1,4-alpha-glucan branching enzyme [Phycisphaerales bacterium]|nr:1,4-alpha-glucan branching enzyme [Phycisphaerales bacterium]
MYEQFGAIEDPANPGVVTFRLFVPSDVPSQFEGGGLPRIKSVRVVGDFQQPKWNAADPTTVMQPAPKAVGGVTIGQVYSVTTPKLADNFYEYKFYIEFQNADPRYIADPCTRYGGSKDQNSAIAVGGNDEVVPALANRPPLNDLMIYELMIGDFAQGAPGQGVSPIDTITGNLQHLVDLGVNAIEIMPWTAWPDDGFSWGYNPFSYYSVAHQYALDAQNPSDKIVYLKRLIRDCHAKGIAVILDGVFNHAEAGAPPRGFGYYWLYQDTADSPYVGNFAAHDYGLDLDYANGCVLQFIADACKYWIDNFEIDGIRLDNTLGFYKSDDRGHGLPALLADLRDHLSTTGRKNFSLILEHSWDYDAIDVVNKVGATGCWLDKYRSGTMDMLGRRQIDPGIMRLLDACRDFGEGRSAVSYIENHDHQRFMNKVGTRDQWYRTRPYAIALFTSPGAVMIYNGQEWGQMDWMPEPGPEERQTSIKRVSPRPLRWNELNDGTGQSLWDLYTKLTAIRSAHPALRSSNFHPRFWDEGNRQLGPDLFGIDADRQIVIYHRWGDAGNGRTDRYTVVLNFSDSIQRVVAPLNVNGVWEDLLSGWKINVTDGRWGFDVGEHNGHVFWNRS